ncbi:hypothetical protein ACFB49_19400 [Sphingomonas sp. DBB INV C78]|uniref:hypothetical protein n=1 Tax=Sphingomonas sp. DBB INV C78 TaxID=3349434 RepID=UPI0036D43716
MKPVTIVAALVLGSASLLSLGVHPILLGGLEEAGRLSKAGIGQTATLELFCLALGAAIGGYRMGRSAMRVKTAIVTLGLVAINIATAQAETMAMVLLSRAIAGFLSGLLYGAANAIIVRSDNPDRLTGILVGGSMIPSVVLAYVIPVFLIPDFGIGAGFYALAACMIVASVFVVGLVDKVSVLERSERIQGWFNLPLILFAVAIVLQSGGLGAAWAYIERLADQHSFGPSVVGLAVAGSLGSQVAAAWSSAWIVPKVPKSPALLLLAVTQAGFIALCIVTDSSAAFITSVCIFGGAAAAMQAFQVAQIIALDPTRRTAVLVSPLILFGNGSGPLIASFVTTEVDVRGGSWAAAVMTAASALFFLASLFRFSRTNTRSPLPSAYS